MIRYLVLISHSQWIYWEKVVHKPAEDGLKVEAYSALKSALHEQLAWGTDGFNPADHHLLDMDFDTLWKNNGIEKYIWLCVIQIARGHKLENIDT